MKKQQQESPQDYIVRAMQELNLSYRKVEARATALGHKMSGKYLHNIASGLVGNPSIRLVQAIAAGLGKPEDELFAVFRGKQLTAKATFGALDAEFNTLPAGDQRALRATVDMIRREIRRRQK